MKPRLPDRDGTFTSQRIAGKTPTPTPTPTGTPTFGSGGWIGEQLKHWWDYHAGFNPNSKAPKKTKTPKYTPTVTPTPHH